MNDIPTFRALAVATKAKDHARMIESAEPFLAQMAKKNGFTIDTTFDVEAISDENLARCAVFVMLQLAPFEMPEPQQAALQRFIERGGGWVGIHAAGLTGNQFLRPGTTYWQWYEDLLGGVTYSPHPAYQTGEVIVEDRSHPATRSLPERFEMADEWYEFDASPRGRVRVLASADESTYKQNRPMGDHPIVWVNEQYRRAIYIGLGHDPSALSVSPYATLIRDSILWAASGE